MSFKIQQNLQIVDFFYENERLVKIFFNIFAKIFKQKLEKYSRSGCSEKY